MIPTHDMSGALNVSKSTHASSTFIASKFSKETAFHKSKSLLVPDDPMIEADENTQNEQSEQQFADPNASILQLQDHAEKALQGGEPEQDLVQFLNAGDSHQNHNMGQDLNLGTGQVQISHSQPVTGSGLPLCTQKSDQFGEDLNPEFEQINKLEDPRTRLQQFW